MKKYNIFFSFLFGVFVCSVPVYLIAQSNRTEQSFSVGASVEVLSSGKWYAAKVKEVRGANKWFISYDGWSSYWDEEVGPNRIRAIGALNPQHSTIVTAPKKQETFVWPSRPNKGSTPLEGAYLQLIVYSYPYTSYHFISWFFTRNGRYSNGPDGGVSLAHLSTKTQATKYEGIYWVEGDQLFLAAADGSPVVKYSGYKTPKLAPIGAGATKQRPFPKEWRFDGSYEGGASIGGGAMSSSNSLDFKRDGTFTRGAITNVNSTGRNSEVSGGVSSTSNGTYQFDEYTLTLRTGGIEQKFTVFAYGDSDALGRPEQIFWQGSMIKRLNR